MLFLDVQQILRTPFFRTIAGFFRMRMLESKDRAGWMIGFGFCNGVTIEGALFFVKPRRIAAAG